jgi:hypothetical protein
MILDFHGQGLSVSAMSGKPISIARWRANMSNVSSRRPPMGEEAEIDVIDRFASYLPERVKIYL